MANIDIMTTIEGPLFSAELNLAAGKKAFSRNLREHPLFGELRAIAKTPEGRTEVIKRVAELAGHAIDPRYEHPADVAFSAYLLVLDETAGPEIVAPAATLVFSAPNCSWSVGVSRELLTKAFASGATTVSTSFTFVPAAPENTFAVYRRQAVPSGIMQSGNLDPDQRLILTPATGQGEPSSAANADQSLVPSKLRRKTLRGHRSPPSYKTNRPGRYIRVKEASLRVKRPLYAR